VKYKAVLQRIKNTKPNAAVDFVSLRFTKLLSFIVVHENNNDWIKSVFVTVLTPVFFYFSNNPGEEKGMF